jgi:hypothetical protein
MGGHQLLMREAAGVTTVRTNGSKDDKTIS